MSNWHILFNSYSSWFILSFAPRLVLMRCTTRSEVVFLERSFYFRGFLVLQIRVITEETLKCPVGKVPIKSLFSSSKHSLFSKACLFPAIGFAFEISASYRRVTRQIGAWRISKEQKGAIIFLLAHMVIKGWVQCSQSCSLIAHRSALYLSHT